MGQFSVEKPVAPGSVLSGNQQSFFFLSRAEATMSRFRTLGTTLVLALSMQLTPNARAAPPPIVVPVMQKDLADVPGKEMVMLTVEYPPGAIEHVHRHDAYAFVYVLEGSIIEGGHPDSLAASARFG
jgi:hypothetical protein